MLHNLSLDTIEHQTTNSNFERGRLLYQKGGVVEFKFIGSDFVSARVSGHKLYHVFLEYKNNTYKAYCNCLYEPKGQCKHQVAVKYFLLNTMADQKTNSSEKPFSFIPLGLYHFLLKNYYKLTVRLKKGIFQ